MAVKPTATNQQDEQDLRGDGSLGKTTDYLRNDPTSYYYQSLKNSGNKYLRDDMWSEAAKRGESASLINALQKANKYESIGAFDKWESYAGKNDYDGYMLSLAIPELDNAEKKERKDEQTGYVFGNYTDQEWALEILNHQFEGYEAEQIEENKANQNFFVSAGAYLASGVNRVASGVTGFLSDIYNLGEGIVNLFADFGKDEDWGDRFLWAFSDDSTDPLGKAKEYFQFVAFDYERRYTSIVDATQAHEQGYSYGSGSNYFERLNNTVGVGAGNTTWGRWWTAGTESIGYMLPSMLIPAGALGKAAGAVKQGVFYTGIFSGNVKDTVSRITMNGGTYKDLNAGIVVANAALKAGAQLAVEKALGYLMGFSGLDRMMGTAGKAASKATSNVAATGLKAAGQVVGRLAKDMLKEGLEEAFQDMSDGIIDSCFGGDYLARGLETLNIQNLVDSFIVGALVSGVTSTISNLSVVLPSQRAIGVDTDGKLYKMGAAQTLNFREAMRTMNEWNDTINDKKASAQAKADAAFRMSIAMDTVGSVLKDMGVERAMTANKVLMAQLEIEATKADAMTKLSDTGYAQSLFTTFQKAQADATAKYVTEKTADKIKKATERAIKKLKKAGVTKIDNVVTQDTQASDPNIPTNAEATKTVKSALGGIGAEAIVGVDGAIVTKSEGIVFVDNKLIQNGDIAEIIKGIAYDQVQDTVAMSLSAAQKKMIQSQYSKITGTDGTIEDAITALLFDKNFYTNILLLSGERRYKMPAIEMLATIDKLVKSKVSADLANGKISDSAYKKLMERVQQTMRTGLVNYATQYVKLDLGQIDNAVLSAELKKEISDHRNTRFTEAVNEGVADTSNTAPTNDRVKAYDSLIDKFITKLSTEEIAEGKRKARSSNYNDRVDAYTLLTQLAKMSKTDSDKVVYLPGDGTSIVESAHLDTVAEFFGTDWMSLVDGTFDQTTLPREAVDFIQANGYDLLDKQSRMSAIREVLFNKSNKTLTIGNDGTTIKVFEKNDFAKEEYLSKDGNAKLLEDIKSGKVKTLGDIAKVELPADIAGFSIKLDPNMVRGNGSYTDGTDFIVIRGNDAINTIMHEATHATQSFYGYGAEVISGGDAKTFGLLPTDVLNSLETYLKENFSLSFNYLKNSKTSSPQILYFMLSGELQANSTMTTHMFEVGFRWKNDRQELVSPDGKLTWSMKPGISQGTEALLNALKKTPKKKTPKAADTTTQTAVEPENEGPSGINLDSPLTPSAKEEMAKDPAVVKFMAPGFLKTKNGTPIVWYRGTDNAGRFDAASGNAVSRIGEFYTLDYKTASGYATGDLTRGYITNVTRADTAIYDAKGADWAKLDEVFTPKDKQILAELVSKYSKYADMADAVGYNTEEHTITTNEVDAAVRKKMGTEWDAVVTEAMTTYNLTRDEAIKVIAASNFDAYTTDNLALVNKVQGKKAVVMKNVQEDAIQPVTNLVLMESGHQKRVTFNRGQINWEKAIGPKGRYISNKVAAESNLKYWIQKGKQIQIDPGVAEFVIATTNDFDSLPEVLKKKIRAASLTKYDIIDYVATTSKMTDKTFQAIARYVFHNEELAKIKYKDMRKMMEVIESLAALSYVTDDGSKKLTPDEMIQLHKAILTDVDRDTELGDKYLKASKRAQTVKVYHGGKASFVEAHADTKQLNSAFFRHYNGTLDSVRDINNLGKFMSTQQAEQELIENVDTGNIDNTKASTAWNWLDKMKKAEIDYEQDEVADTLENMDRQDKINELERYIVEVITAKLMTLPEEVRKAKGPAALRRVEMEIAKLEALSDVDIDKRYIAALASESMRKQERSVDGIVKPASNEPTTKNRKDRLRNLGRTISTRIAGLKTRYNSLSPEVKKYIDPANKYKLSADYRKLSDAELDLLISAFSEDSKRLRERIRKVDTAKLAKQQTADRIDRMAKKAKTAETKNEQKQDTKDKKSVREKIQVVFTHKIKEQTFEFNSKEKPNSLIERLLDTAWDKTRKTTVQGLSNNKDQNVTNGKQFFEQNAELLMGATTSEIDEAVRWFLDARMNNMQDEEAKKFSAIKLYFLGYIFGETGAGKLFSNLDHNLKKKIEDALRNEATIAGTMLSVWNNIHNLIDPTSSMKNANMEIDGVALTDEEKDILFEAANSGNIDAIKQIQQKIIERISKEKTAKKSILRKITTIRSMSMLSSPVTWLRNIVSNFALKRLNKLSSSIGNKIWTGKTVSGQLKMTGAVTPEIQKFINEHFIDNGLFETLVSNLSRYNPSDISARNRDATGKASKDAIFAQMVIKSMYNQYYNENMFENKFMNSVHQKLMKVLSDNNYVREASIRYFGKMMAEKGYDLKDNNVTDAIMNDFASAIGLGLSDYMHSDNIFNKLESEIAKRAGEGGLFAYKTLLPFASAGFQWFKAALKLSPIGLGRAIINMATLERRVALATDKFNKGESQVSPELTEYIARRDLGQGVIGTVAWTVGMLLAGLGFIGLEDDDYGKPKLRIGNLKIDVSSIFGSSSLLAGAALITGIKDKGMTWDGWLEGLNRMADVTLDGLPLMQIVEMDMYSNGSFSMGLDQLESIALSFIPNILKWFAGATYSGSYDKKTFLGKATAGIPFLGGVFNEKKVDPYTGGEGSWWEAFNRFVPYISVDIASQTEKDSKALGLNKEQLKGQYKINDKEFKLSAKETNAINQAYGQWNAADIANFYQNRTSLKIKVGKGYKTLSFNQMDDTQRKAAVQQIMSDNARYAKIMAWLRAGNKYYASAGDFAILRKRGIVNGLYKGTKGYVEK